MKQLARMIAAFCLFVTLLVLRELPAEIPAHYDFVGNITRWGSKYELLILPVLLLLVSFGSRFLLLRFHRKAEQAESDKERQAAAANAKVLGIVIFSQTLILSCIQGVLLYNTVLALRGESFLSTFAGEKLLTILCGSLLLVPGDILPKCRRNGMVGFRLPWTKYNDITWQKSNRFAGRMLVAAGTLGIVSTVFAPKGYGMFLLSIYIMAAIVISTVRAWQVYREEKAKEQS
ncbi:SdpI family protein [Stomatobaculum longum]|uniref:SdpI family protein n=1 Tax=Stomatobaculum longum TaxID=796942 RepID=UPI0028EA2818|nr:SdpI family protein [Stomatobaculum longum]